ncbi:trans-aconitate 2-methyltransferase [Pararhizobium sp.]|uniref:trans-aconitate 2-methyltransferase n=1 Tax=Pararhizobium sp. TaxID=1977563 RepID=UPI0027166145|nr:trans-aconitate 2-methyltransferase [Pararhizobium sp.]MDO9417234.1 trans-aconitate 2-methyltransferase [Pararhizobium sp.]
MAWSASQYLKFENERTRPARDLLDQVPQLPKGGLYDLGCGPGNSTELIARRFPGEPVTGIDSDDDMLAAAKKRLPELEFLKADIGGWTPPAPAALLYANALFQWIPDHLGVLVRLMDGLSPAGVLAVQMPDNLDADSHRLMEDMARSPRWRQFYDGFTLARATLPAPSAYIERLGGKAAFVTVWHTTYYHQLDNAASIVEWVKGTGLRPYLDHLPPETRDGYLADYLAEITSAYPAMADGRVLLPFKRLFVVAVKAG